MVLQPVYCASKLSINIADMQLCSLGHFTDITVQPVSINTTLNSNVTFTCEAIRADELTFRVNNTPANNNISIHKGFMESTTNSTGTIRGELQAKAYVFNNNTHIRCRVLSANPHALLFSKTALLLIQGSENFF